MGTMMANRKGYRMGEELKGKRIARSGLALTLVGTLMVPSTAAFAAPQDEGVNPPLSGKCR